MCLSGLCAPSYPPLSLSATPQAGAATARRDGLTNESKKQPLLWLSRWVRLFPLMMVRDKPLDTFHLLHLTVDSAVRAGSSSTTSRTHRMPPYRAVLCSFWPRATVSGHAYTPLRPLSFCFCFCLLVFAHLRDDVVSAVGGLGDLVPVMPLPLLPVCLKPPAGTSPCIKQPVHK